MKCLANTARVIVSCAGPFARFGSVLVNCCAAYGTDYVDITGEIDWVRQCIVKYGDLAARSGARIVSCCGFDCVPSDLLFYKLDKKLKEEYGESTEMASLEIWDEGFFAGLSGGTVNSLFNSFEGRQDGTKSGPGLGFDPLNKINSTINEISLDLEKFEKPGPGKNVNLSKKYMHHDKTLKKWCGFNFIILQNFRMIQRTNSLLGITKKLFYTEKMVYNDFMIGFLQNFLDFFMVTVFTIGFLKDFSKKHLPNSGEGPSEASMKDSYITLYARAKSGVVDEKKSAQEVGAYFYFPQDPGYVDTARIVGECGLCFVFDKENIKTKGGMWTPSSCFGDLILDRLVESGSEFGFIGDAEEDDESCGLIGKKMK